MINQRMFSVLVASLLLTACGAIESPDPIGIAGKGDAPSGQISFPSNVHRARQLFLFGNGYTADVVQQVTAVVDRINLERPQLKARLLVNDDPGMMLLGTDELAQLGYTRGDAQLADSLKHALVYTRSGMAPDLWMQDHGQFYYHDNTPVFLDLNYGPQEVAAALHGYVADPRGVAGAVNTSFNATRTEATINTTLEGGDLEVLPDGKLLVGSELHPGLEQYLQHNLGQQTIRVPVGFINTGHVDEVFAIVPAPRAQSNGCGFALAYIDPLYGLRLALDRALSHQQTDNRQQYIDAISYFTDEDGESLIHYERFRSIPGKFIDKDLEILTEPFGKSPNYAQWYVARAVDIHNKVQQGIAIIRAALAHSCDNLKAVGLPVIFSDIAAEESTLMNVPYDETTSDAQLSVLFKAAPVNMHYSPVNMLVLNQHLLLPVPESLAPSGWSVGFGESFKGTYQGIVQARLEQLGIAPEHLHFIRSNGLIHNGGSLHCGTLTQRSRDELVY